MNCLDQSSPFNWVTDSSVRNTRGSSVPTSPISIYGDRYWIIYFLKDHTFSQVPSRIIPLLNNVRNYNYAFCQSPHVLHAFTFTDNVNHFLRYFSLLSVLVLTSGERKRRDPRLSQILDSTLQIRRSLGLDVTPGTGIQIPCQLNLDSRFQSLAKFRFVLSCNPRQS